MATRQDIDEVFGLADQLMPVASETYYSTSVRKGGLGGIVLHENVEVIDQQNIASYIMEITDPFYGDDASALVRLEFAEDTDSIVLLTDENDEDPSNSVMELARQLCISVQQSGALNDIESGLVSRGVGFLAGFLDGYYDGDKTIHLGKDEHLSCAAAVGRAITARTVDFIAVREFDTHNPETGSSLTITSYQKTNPHKYRHYPATAIDLYNHDTDKNISLRLLDDGRVVISEEDEDYYDIESEEVSLDKLRMFREAIAAAIDNQTAEAVEAAESPEELSISPFTDLINKTEAAYNAYLAAKPDSEEKGVHELEASQHLKELSEQFENTYHATAGLFVEKDPGNQETLIRTSKLELLGNNLSRNAMMIVAADSRQPGLTLNTDYILYEQLKLAQHEQKDGTIINGVFIMGFRITNEGYEPFFHRLHHTNVLYFCRSDN